MPLLILTLLYKIRLCLNISKRTSRHLLSMNGYITCLEYLQPLVIISSPVCDTVDASLIYNISDSCL